jgi:hypothetical protein
MTNGRFGLQVRTLILVTTLLPQSSRMRLGVGVGPRVIMSLRSINRAIGFMAAVVRSSSLRGTIGLLSSLRTSSTRTISTQQRVGLVRYLFIVSTLSVLARLLPYQEKRLKGFSISVRPRSIKKRSRTNG